MNTEHADVLPGTLETMILAVLEPAPLHGFAVARAIEARSADRLTIEEGSLYPALRRLERQGYVTPEWGKSPTGRRARFYSLTDAGSSRLTVARRQWTIDAEAVSSVLSPKAVKA